MIKRSISLALLALAAIAGLPATALSAERTMIVLDASGSMWGRIDGKPKLEIAREALRQVLGKIPASTEIGLMAYGHREKGNCADIELVVPPGAGNAAKIGEAAGRLRFLGKTPLSEAVKQAAVSMRYTEEKATVILITDGIETCAADPCALGEELKKAGVGFTAHVVGFGLTREEGRQVACLAENTGGRYIPAGNEQELRDALSRTVASGPPPPKAAPAPLPKASVSPKAPPVIGQTFPIEWTGPGARGDYVDLVPPGFKEMTGELSYVYVKANEPAAIRAPAKPGAYELRYIWEGPDGRRVAAVTPITVGDATSAISAPSTLPVGTPFSAEWKGPGESGDYVDIVPAGFKGTSGELGFFYVRDGNPATFKAPSTPGNYLLRYIVQGSNDRKVLVSVPLTVTKADVSLSLPPNATVGGEVTVNWRGPGGKGDYIDVVPEGFAATSGEIDYAYVAEADDGETVTIRMPGQPGRYSIRYVVEAPGGRKVLASEIVTVAAASATLKAPAGAAPGARVDIAFTGPSGKGDYVDIVPEGFAATSGEIGYFYTREADDGTGTLTMPDKPGRYDIRYLLEAPGGGRRVLAKTTIEVR